MDWTESSLKQVQQLLIDGKISTTQFTRLCIQRVGLNAFMKAFNSTLLEEYKNFKLNKEKKNENAVQDQSNIQ